MTKYYNKTGYREYTFLLDFYTDHFEEAPAWWVQNEKDLKNKQDESKRKSKTTTG